MAYSSILGAERAPSQPSGRGADLLGPSDSSDTGSDTVGTDEAHADSDTGGTGERGAVAGEDAIEGADIMPDRIVQLGDAGDGPEQAFDGDTLADLDAADDGEAADGD
jgi:hypothetical protein